MVVFDKRTFQERLEGKVISMVGNPAAGKTFLAEKLATFLDAEILYENSNNKIPEEIKRNLKHQRNLFETIIHFRNVQLSNYLRAQSLVKTGKTVILDTPFYNYQLFIDHYVQDKFYRNVLYRMGELDFLTQESPDITIYIKTNPALVAEFLNRRYGNRDWEETEWTNFISKMPPKLDAYFQSIRNNLRDVIVIERADFDFAKDEDFCDFLNIFDEIDF